MIRRLAAAEAGTRLEESALLLRDGVEGGASIGVLLPPARTEIEACRQSLRAPSWGDQQEL